MFPLKEQNQQKALKLVNFYAYMPYSHTKNVHGQWATAQPIVFIPLDAHAIWREKCLAIVIVIDNDNGYWTRELKTRLHRMTDLFPNDAVVKCSRIQPKIFDFFPPSSWSPCCRFFCNRIKIMLLNFNLLITDKINVSINVHFYGCSPFGPGGWSSLP